ncbi:MAG: hypothetical protein HXJ92_01685 [candidate division SR1 bacterium]|nr:hypothetical protein [candidate division SR1 bacterium]
MQGWVKLQRSILQQAVWAKPPEYLKIYTYLVVSVDRISGEFYTNYQTISETCGVKKTVVDHFFRWAKETGLLATQKRVGGMLVILYLNSGFFSFDDESDGEKTVKNSATAIATAIATQKTAEKEAQELKKSNTKNLPTAIAIATATATTKNKNIPTTVGIDKAKALSVSREDITSFLSNLLPGQILKLGGKEYGDSEINECLAIIKAVNGNTIEGTQKSNRQFAGHLLSLLRKEENVITGSYTRQEVLATLLQIISQSADTFWLPKIASPEQIYRNLNKLKAFAKAYVAKIRAEQIKEAEKKTGFTSF